MEQFILVNFRHGEWVTYDSGVVAAEDNDPSASADAITAADLAAYFSEVMHKPIAAPPDLPLKS